MAITDKIKKIFTQYNRPELTPDTSRAVDIIPQDAGSVLSSFFGGSTKSKNPLSQSNEWQLGEFTEESLKGKKGTDIIEVLRNVSPDFDKVITDLHQHVSPDIEIIPKNLQSRNDKRAADYLNESYDSLNDIGKNIDDVINGQITNLYSLGGSFTETLLADNKEDFGNVINHNPLRIEYEVHEIPRRGSDWAYGETINSNFVNYTIDPLVEYIGINRRGTGAPYGRPLVASAIFPLVFDLMFLKDIRQVVKTQGNPVLQAKVDREQIAKTNPDPKIVRERAAAVANEVATAWSLRKPNDAIRTGEEVTLEFHSGLTGSNLQGLNTIIESLEKKIFRGLKTYPVLIGSSQSQTEAQTRIQLILWNAIVKSFRKIVFVSWQRRNRVILQAKGIAGEVDMRTGELRTYTPQEDLTVQKLVQDTVKQYLENANTRMERGILSIEEFVTEYDLFIEELGRTLENA